MSINYVCGVLLILSTFHAQSSEYFYSGNDLIKSMLEYKNAMNGSESANYSEAWKFRAYVVGVHDTVNGLLVCPPKGFDEIQATYTVMKYFEQNSAQWHRNASRLVVDALTNYYPCKK